MNNENRLIKAIKHPEWVLGVVIRHTPIARWMSDRSFIKWEFFSGMRKFPNLKTPKTYNEKLQWLKLNNIHPEYARMVDKAEAKEYVREQLGDGADKHIIPTLGVWDTFDEIDFNALPNQ